MKFFLIKVVLVFLALNLVNCKNELLKWDEICRNHTVRNGKYAAYFIPLNKNKVHIAGVENISAVITIKNNKVDDVSLSLSNPNYAKYHGNEKEFRNLQSVAYLKLRGCKEFVMPFSIDDFE